MRSLTLIALLIAGCGPKDAPVQAAAAPVRTLPGPLPTPAFKMPETQKATLSNGIEVVVATNTEVPLWELRLTFKAGGYLDPQGKDGLAEITFGMLNDGAGDLTSADIARKSKQLGAYIGSGAGVDMGYVTAGGLKRTLEPTLDLMTTILTEPTFPADEWEIQQKRLVADVIAAREDPSAVARTVAYKLMYGPTYRGRHTDESSLESITTADMKAWYGTWVGPANARIFVGGDVTLDEVLPLLEARLGSWKPAVTEGQPAAELAATQGGTLYFVDKPGAAQSVVRVMTRSGTRFDEDYFSLLMANAVIGGQFTSRVNMNLREDKGYTYGARCFDAQWDGPGVWGCSTNVQTEVTLPAMVELRKEITDARGDRPVTEEELAYFVSSEVNGFPAPYESVGAVLGEQADIWRYGLPTTWPEDYLPQVEAVTAESANAAFKKYIDPDKLLWVVVGDKATIWEDLQTFGLEVVELDRDGNPIGGK